MPHQRPPDVHEFIAPVLRHQGEITHHYVPLPMDVAEAIENDDIKTVRGRINGKKFRRVVWGRGDGAPSLMFGLAFLRAAGARVGDLVEMELWEDTQPDHVDICPEFEAALQQDPEAAALFHALTPGRRRSLAHYVDGAKRAETRVRRALSLMRKLKTNTLVGDTGA